MRIMVYRQDLGVRRVMVVPARRARRPPIEVRGRVRKAVLEEAGAVVAYMYAEGEQNPQRAP